MFFFSGDMTTDYGTVTISGALIALAAREGFAYLGKRDNQTNTALLIEMRDGINELVQESRTSTIAIKAAAAAAAGRK